MQKRSPEVEVGLDGTSIVVGVAARGPVDGINPSCTLSDDPLESAGATAGPEMELPDEDAPRGAGTPGGGGGGGVAVPASCCCRALRGSKGGGRERRGSIV